MTQHFGIISLVGSADYHVYCCWDYNSSIVACLSSNTIQTIMNFDNNQ